MTRRARALLAAATLCATTACKERAERAERGALPPATASTAPEPKTPPPEPAPNPSTERDDRPHFAAKECRAIVVQGTPKDAQGNVIPAMASLDGTVWLHLPDKSSITVKHAVTGRELTFTGPGLVLPCKDGKEWFVLVRGRVTTTTWAGAAPGAEVLLATPFTLVRYGDATLDVSVEDSRLLVKAVRGDAWLESGKEDGASDRKVAAGTQEVRPGAPEDPKALLSNCERASARAESMARDVLSGKPDVALGESAAAHVRARRAATAACAVADAALGRLALGAEREDLARAVKKAEARYRTLPSRLEPANE